MKTSRIILSVVAVIAFIGIVVGAYFLKDAFTPDVQEGDKTITFAVISADDTKTYTIHTDAEFLADALVEEGILSEKSSTGMYTVIDGIEASWEADSAWWCIALNGTDCMVGMNEQVITDGDAFTATYTVSAT